MRQRILLVVTCLVLVLPAAAEASSRQFTTVEAPSELLGPAPESALDQIRSLGATAIRLQLNWNRVAPSPDARRAPAFNATDPNAYPGGSWSPYDRVIDAARARGLQVLLTLTGPAPKWATPGRRDGLTRPSASAFRKFATAAGRRYRTRVAWWSVWNEPNLGKFLKPIAGLASATVYRNLYLQAYGGLHAAGVSAPILIGELAPIGNAYRDIGTIRPLRFLRAMLCLDERYRRGKKRCAKVPTAGFAMHPYTTAVGPRLVPQNPDDVTIGVLGRLTHALDLAARAGAVPRRLPVYVTEFGVQSYPDRLSGVPLATQSDYRSLAEYIAYRNPRVRSFSQYLLRDDRTIKGGFGAFESGLFLYRGNRPKPALQSFRLPLVVLRAAHGRATLWGLVRPARQAGTVTIQYRDRGRGWRTLATQRHGAGGSWQRGAATRPGRAWRVRWTAPDGTRYTGPATIAR